MTRGIARSLTLKWMAFSILLATIPLAIAGYSIIQIYQENLKKSIIETEKEKAQIVSERTQAFFEKALNNLLVLSKYENFRKGGLSSVKSHFENVLYINDYLVELTLLDKKGHERVKFSKYQVFHPSDLKNQSKSKMFEVASKGQTYYGEFHLTTDAVPTLVIAVPIEESGRGPSAVLSAKVHLRYLWDLLPQSQIGEEGSTYVVNQEGDLIAHPDTRRVLLGLNVKDRPVVKEAINRKQGYFEFEYPEGGRDLVVYKPIRELGWGVIVQVPVKEAYKPLRQVAHAALKWIFVAFSIAIILSFFLTKQLTLPIKSLTKEMGEVAKGNLNSHIEPTSKDEIGLLTESFNHMVQDLKQSHESLKKAENKYRRIFEDSKDTVYVTSVDGEIIDINQAGVDLLGYESKEELIGLNAQKTYVYPEDRGKFRQEIEREGFIRDYEIKLRKKDGTEMDCLLTATVRRTDDEKTVGYQGIIRDITELKRTEEALRQSSQFNREVISNATEGIIVYDREFRYEVWNRFMENLTGIQATNILGKCAFDLFPHLREQGVDRLLEHALHGETVSSPDILYRIPNTDKWSWVSGTYGPHRDARGGIIGVIGIVRDITERKRAEEALRQSEKRATQLSQENAIMAEIGRIVSSTLKIEEVYGRFAEEVRKLIPFDRIAVNTINSDRASVTLTYTFGVKIRDLQEGASVIMERRFCEDIVNRRSSVLIQTEDERELAGGYPNFVKQFRAGLRSMIAVPLISQDQLIGILHIQSLKPNAYTEYDVRLAERVGNQIGGAIANAQLYSERRRAEEALRQSEEKYRTVLENIDEGYYEVDLAGNFTFFNDSMSRIWGYPREELIGVNNRQYTDKENAKKVFQAFNRVYKTGEPGREFDWEIIRKDGTKRYIETSVSLRKDASGKPIGFRGIIRDITDRKKIEEQLFQAEKLRAVGEMATGVAHDFNNALTAILGNTQLLLYTVQDEELKETLKIIKKVSEDSSQTVRRLQDFTRKGIHQELSKVDINAIIKDSIEITKPKWKDEAQGKGILIEMVSNLEDIPLASGTNSELREVITNMIFNAIEAMHEGGKIEIRTFKKRKDIHIQISDTGVGIAEETKKRIFEPFFTTKPFTNTGLGLSMSYGIVKRFGGEIQVESKVGQGTTFTIILPIGEDEREEKEEAVDSEPIKRGRRARILVIDDDAFVRSVLSRTLAQADHQVTLAEDGIKGVKLFKEREFDVVLTDLGMPGMSGWEVCRMIKEMSPHTPVGMITGWGDERNRSKMEEYGLDFFISKPFDLAQILNAVAETMESRKERFLS